MRTPIDPIEEQHAGRREAESNPKWQAEKRKSAHYFGVQCRRVGVRGKGDESILCDKWTADRVFVQVPMQALAAKWLESFKEFPVRQKSAAFNLDQVMEKFEKAGAGAN